MSTQVFDGVAFAAPILTLLRAVTGLDVYDGEVPAPPTLDPDGGVHPHAVYNPGTAPTLRSSQSGPSTLVPWSFQVTAVGGDRQRCDWAARAVCTALVDVRPTVATWSCSRISQTPGPGMSRDNTEQPARFYWPLTFTLTATPT